MTDVKTVLFCAVSAACFGMSTPVHASDIQTKKECEAADGMASRMNGVLTCTLPLLEPDMREAGKHVTDCSGEVISGGSFCQMIIDPKYKKSALDCAAVNAPIEMTREAYDAWFLEVDTPMTDAWKCQREKRIKAQRAKAKKAL